MTFFLGFVDLSVTNQDLTFPRSALGGVCTRVGGGERRVAGQSLELPAGSSANPAPCDATFPSGQAAGHSWAWLLHAHAGERVGREAGEAGGERGLLMSP